MQNQVLNGRSNLLIIFLITVLSAINCFTASAIGIQKTENNVASTVQNQPGNGSLLDANIKYVGRWDKSSPNVYHSYWTGAYIRVNFTGKSIGIRLASGSGLVVSIDGENPRAVNAGQGNTQLNISALSEGTHTLLVGSLGQNYEVLFLGLVLESGAVTYKPDSKTLIEFIGDSITAFTGPEATPDVNWAWNTAEILGCDHTQIAFSGIALTSGYGCLDKKIGMDSLYFNFKNYNHLSESPQLAWTFDYTPDVVFIELGTNDKCGSPTDAVFMRSATTFLNRLRAKYSNAEIVVMRPFNGSYEGPLSTVVRKMNEAGDPKVYFIDTTDWLTTSDFSDGTHPNLAGGQKIVDGLVPILRPIVQNISILPIVKSDQISVIPNPFNDELKVESAQGIIKSATIRNISGKKMALFSINKNESTLKLNNLATGHYLLTLTMDNGEETTQIIVKQ